MSLRIYITGGAGTGTTTLGRALSAALGVTHLDTDDFYWAPVDPPYTAKRGVAERLALLGAAQGPGGWVLSGSADGWGDPVLTEVDLVVFLRLPTAQRMLRLRRREQARFGDRVAPGGDMERTHRAFLDWASSYDDPYFGGRSLHRHLSWLSTRSEPVLELSGAVPTEAQVEACLGVLAPRRVAEG